MPSVRLEFCPLAALSFAYALDEVDPSARASPLNSS